MPLNVNIHLCLSVFGCSSHTRTPAEEQTSGTTNAAFSYTPFSEPPENDEVWSLVLYVCVGVHILCGFDFSSVSLVVSANIRSDSIV